MTTHDLKSWPEFFKDIVFGSKHFELRRNDRGYQVGDIIVLREWEPNTKEYTGRQCARKIIYVMKGLGNVGVIEPYKGLGHDFVILGLSSEAVEQP